MRLNEIYNAYKDKMDFLLIYTREAHPADGWQVQNNLDQNIIFNEPTSDGERTEIAAICQLEMDINMPMLIDGVDNEVEEKYISLPMRLFLIDKDGNLAYVGDRGPRGFDTDSWVGAIEQQIKATADA